MQVFLPTRAVNGPSRSFTVLGEGPSRCKIWMLVHINHNQWATSRIYVLVVYFLNIFLIVIVLVCSGLHCSLGNFTVDSSTAITLPAPAYSWPQLTWPSDVYYFSDMIENNITMHYVITRQDNVCLHFLSCLQSMFINQPKVCECLIGRRLFFLNSKAGKQDLQSDPCGWCNVFLGPSPASVKTSRMFVDSTGVLCGVQRRASPCPRVVTPSLLSAECRALGRAAND